MSYQLIICEKPSAAMRIAYALGGTHVRRERYKGLPVFWLEIEGKRVAVVPALGHLYGVEQNSTGWSFPIFDLRWAPLKDRRKRMWIEAIAEIAKGADSYVCACDFDVEGSLIGYTILRYACGGVDIKAKRMRFSTLTKEELRSAYKNALGRLDYERVYAGKVRHEVDWIFGVNTSRALMDAMGRAGGGFEVLSAGRVQSPTLYALCRREVEINLHVPDPFWSLNSEVVIKGAKYPAEYKVKEFFSRKEAEDVAERCQGKRGYVKDVLVKRKRIPPPPPFNLGDLQREAYRVFGYSPSKTQRIAERLYLSAAVSYPRTSSQKLPHSLGLGRIIEKLGRTERYREAARRILEKGIVKPREGRSTDPAHPAIHPTGTLPKRMSGEEGRIFDLIVRRFFATFGEDAILEEREAVVEVNERDSFKVRARDLVESGWTEYYRPYVAWRKTEGQRFEVNDEAIFVRVDVEDKFTAPPERYTASKLIAYMERQGLGTKSTRAEIIDNLYRRGYIEGREIKVTDLGFAVVGILKRFFPELVSVKMTSALEGDMVEIESGRRDQVEVVLKVVDTMKPVFERIIEKYEEIGEELFGVMNQLRRNELGPCPKCRSGHMRIVRSKKSGKRFIGCDNYPNFCNFSFPIPQRGKISRSNADCNFCGFPIIEVKDGWKIWRFCVNAGCPSNKR
ncbi:MAG: DNA topoisomerase I [Candidatus Methanomethyliales bacterium]|nr:DNA topoisomerase I [Candidatus Methanomethylicales archaeon]